jgi:diguanylate cyclase (GGDEF)-like protein
MKINQSILPSSEGPVVYKRIRRVKWGLKSKFFTSVALALLSYALLSSSYLLNYFYEDKGNYILYSLHQGAESLCHRLSDVKMETSQILRLLRENEYASSFIFDAESEMLISDNTLNVAARNRHGDFWDEIKKRTKGTDVSNFSAVGEVAHKKYFMSACAFEQNKGINWLLFAVDAQDALSPARDLMLKLGLIFIVPLIGGIGIFYVLVTGLTRPLKKLTTLAEDLGAGNYERHIEVKGSDELGALSDSFNILSQRLSMREAELEKTTELANQDFLTGLWNRRSMDKKLLEVFQDSINSKNDLSLIYLDADHFKKVNDTYGHAAGDQVLKELSQLLKISVRETDFISRVGGEEFIVVLEKTDLETAKKFAQLILKNIRDHRFVEGIGHRMTASLGIASLLSEPTVFSATQFIEKADEYAYKSKTSGRNKITFKDGSLS